MATHQTSGVNSKILRYGALAAGGVLLGKALIKSFNKIKVKNKVVLITGGSRGLGLILARKLADENAKVVICARNEEELTRAEDDLLNRTEHVLAIPCDLTDKDQIKRMMREIEEKMGTVDILINNAGVIQTGPMENMQEADYEEAMKIYFWAPFYLMNEVIPSMLKKREGRIVNIVSIGGKVAVPHLLPYDAGKFALSGLSEGVTAEMGKNNIKVTTIYPGLMRTGSPRNIDVKGHQEKEYAWFKIVSSLPLISMNAEKAAEKIINAMKKGEKTLTLTIPAKIATVIHGIAPDLTISFFDLMNRMLPEPDGGNKESWKGFESSSKLSSSFLTRETDEAALKNNEIIP